MDSGIGLLSFCWTEGKASPRFVVNDWTLADDVRFVGLAINCPGDVRCGLDSGVFSMGPAMRPSVRCESFALRILTWQQISCGYGNRKKQRRPAK